MRQALSERRRLANPFNSAGPRADAVAAASVTAASVHLNPRNGPSGCSLWRLCRRLGCDGDVLPLLRAAGMSGTESLRQETCGQYHRVDEAQQYQASLQIDGVCYRKDAHGKKRARPEL